MEAPVREIVAQTISSIIPSMSKPSLKEVSRLLDEAASCELWEVRHSALLALKYIYATNVPLDNLNVKISTLSKGLMDDYDDVRAAAADVLVFVLSQNQMHHFTVI